MTTHALLIGARGRGLITDIQEAAYAKDSDFSTKFAPEALVLTGKTSSFDFLEDGNLLKAQRHSTVVIEDIDGVTDECVKELVSTFVAWTVNNPELEITFYWDIVGLAPERTVEIIQMLLPLVMLG